MAYNFIQSEENDFYQNYDIVSQVGQGGYGVVWKVRSLQNKSIYAAKKSILNEQGQGVPLVLLREISILRKLDHPNIVKLYNISYLKSSKQSVIDSSKLSFKQDPVLIFEYCQHDLLGLIKNKVSFDMSQIKHLLYQFFQGLAYIHSKKIVHRDLKLNNLLLNNEGILKICDFGISKEHNGKMTKGMMNIHSRAPELLLGQQNYDTKVDIWSAGLIMTELITGKKLFFQQNHNQVIKDVMRYTFKSTDKNCFQGNLFEGFQKQYGSQNKSLKKHISSFCQMEKTCLELIASCLKFDPKNRISAEEALKSQFFQTPVYAQLPDIQRECKNYEETEESTRITDTIFIKQNLKRKVFSVDEEFSQKKIFVISI